MKKLFAIVLVVLCLAACKKEEIILTNLETLGNVSPSGITIDSGITLQVTKLSCDDGYTAHERIHFLCNVLKKVSDSKYEVELLQWARVLCKDYVVPGAAYPGSDLGLFPIFPNRVWASGEYLNFEVYTTFLKDSKSVHYLNLEFNGTASDGETLQFTLKHNTADGESMSPDSSLTPEDVSLGRSFLSVPMRNLIPEGSTRKLEITYEWHIIKDGRLTPATEIKTLTGTVTTLTTQK